MNSRRYRAPRGALLLLIACGGDPERGPAVEAVASLPVGLGPGLVQVEPRGLAARITGEVAAGRPDRPDALPVLNGLPPHLRFAFDGDTLTEPVDYRVRQLRVFPVAAYRATFTGGTRAAFDRRFHALASMVAGHPDSITGEIPVFPPAAAEQLFRGSARRLTFGGGQGIAFLAEYARDRDPVSGERLVWVFQGLTDDGAWLVVAFHPVRTSRLPPTNDARQAAAMLDRLAPGDFHPDLERLDAVIASLRIASPPPT